MSTIPVMGRQVSPDWLLRLVVLLAIPTYFWAAWLNLGTYFALDPHIPIIPNRILRAIVVETILGLASLVNLAVLLRRQKRAGRVTFGIQLFLIAGAVLGMVVLSWSGPPPSPDWNLHFLMLAEIAVAMLLLLLRYRQSVKPPVAFSHEG